MSFDYLPLHIEGLSAEDFGEGPYRHVTRKVRLHGSAVAGHGLLVVEPIAKGTVVWAGKKGYYTTYSQADIDAMEPEAKALMLNFGYQVGENAFEGPINQEEVDDDVSSFWNHSCDPNSVIVSEEMWVARRDIQPGEELNADYATFDATLDRIRQCRCGTSLCRGSVRPDDYLLPELQQRYEGHFMPYLVSRIAASSK